MTRAAVMVGADKPLEVHDIKVGDPRANEVRVQVVASGICHSDLSVYQTGGAGMPLPVVLGHEAAGIVQAIGEGVTDLAIGDHVVFGPMPQCGHCFYCERGHATLCETGAQVATGMQFDGTTRLAFMNGEPIAQMSCLGVWSEETVVPATSAFRIDKAMPLPQAALIGCGVVTGFGAATNVADISDGDSVVVVGCGGVGLNAIQGARVAGAGQVIAVDVVDWKLDLARAFGATETIDASQQDAVERVRAVTGGRGADVAIEVVGNVDTMQQVLELTRPGGQCVFTGLSMGGTVSIDSMSLIGTAKTLKANLLGMRPYKSEFPKLVQLYLEGALMLDELITRTIGLEEVNEAFTAMNNGEVARSVIVNS